MEKPLKPAGLVENKLIYDIISGKLPKNSKLPGERDLAKQTGVTRPTLREALQRLSRDGWVTINHGKPTVVNDFWDKGGLGIIRTLTDYIELLPKDLVKSVLEFRTIVFPGIASLACKRDPEVITKFLYVSSSLKTAKDFAKFDWDLQMLVGKCSDNSLFPLILNDFEKSYMHLAGHYFEFKKARDASSVYYEELRDAFASGDDGKVRKVVRDAMAHAEKLWSELNNPQ